MENLKNKINTRKINYQHIKNEESHVLLFDENKEYDVNVIIGARGRKEFLSPLFESFKKAIEHSDKSICFTIVNHAHYPEHLKFCKKNKINYLWTKGNVVDQYSRCFAYNFGVKFSNKAKYYLLHDLDILVKENFFDEIFENLGESKCMQSYGARRVLYLSEELAQKVINGEVDYNKFDVDSDDVSLPMYNGKPALGSKGGSVFIEHNLFYDVGGFDPELFWGYAAEDQFFWEKVKNVSEITYADNPVIDMFHLWHPPSFSTNPLLYDMENDWKHFNSLNKEQKLEIIKLKKELYEK